VWRRVVPHLAGRFHVVTYDVRGAGRSDAPRPLAAYDLDQLVADAVSVVDAVAPGRPFHLVGHDWGSIAGWALATFTPLAGRLRSFTSISGPSLDHVSYWIRRRLRSPTPANLIALLDQARRSWYVRLFCLPGLARAAGAAARLGTSRFARDAAHGMSLYRRNMGPRLRSPAPDPVAHVPVQLVVPAKDPFVSPKLYDDLERWVPEGLHRHAIDAGHWVPLTHPAELAELVGAFVAGVEARLTSSGPGTHAG
jgi:pimeloyl-ACP methyl ester carboxylesterase